MVKGEAATGAEAAEAEASGALAAAPGSGMSSTRRGVPIGAPTWPTRTLAMSSSLGYVPVNT